MCDGSGRTECESQASGLNEFVNSCCVPWAAGVGFLHSLWAGELTVSR